MVLGTDDAMGMVREDAAHHQLGSKPNLNSTPMRPPTPTHLATTKSNKIATRRTMMVVDHTTFARYLLMNIFWRMV
jgi:hypothetical protein